MCTIVFAYRMLDAPVAVAANRDEALDRASIPPRPRGSDPVVVAPRDRAAGGTWIGHTDRGLLVAIANRWLTDGPSGERSRGQLVADALDSPTLPAALRTVERELATRTYDPFTLVLADDRRAVLVEWTTTVRVRPLARGVHVVVNVGSDGRYTIPDERRAASVRQIHVAERLRAALAPRPEETVDTWLGRAADWLADHRVGACVHGDRFGTRSSSLIALGPDRRSFRYADGPPCRTEYHS
ncbi:MAG: NRDE family protein [Halococcoides sp.]